MKARSQNLKKLLADKKIAPLVKKFGEPNLSDRKGTRGMFEALLRSIIHQQLAGAAARTIHARFLVLFPRKKPTPELVLAKSDSELRSVGLSAMKVSYVKDLALKFKENTVPYRKFKTMKSDEIVEHLTKIRGVGEWTVHMFLIFTLNREDILPVGDLAIRKSFEKVYGLKKTPTRRDMERLAEPWREQASLVSWYFWRLADELKKK